MKLDKQQLIIIVLAAVILCGFGFFQYVPVIRERSEIRARMAQQDEIAKTICMRSEMFPELKLQEEELLQELMPFSRKIPEGRHFAQLWQQIADVMNEYNLTNQLVQPGEELKSDQLCKISLALECQGSLEQLYSFLKAMENMERLVRFEKIKFENDVDFKGAVKLYAKACIYYQPDDKGNG